MTSSVVAGAVAALPSSVLSPSSSPAAARPLRGAERFLGLDATVVEFWRYAMSDLGADVVRTRLAEFLVQQALSGSGARQELGGHDVTSADGHRVTVRSAPASEAARASSVVFSGLRHRVPSDAGWAATPHYSADAYVFAVPVRARATDLGPADDAGDRAALLDTRAWQFWVLSRAEVEERGCDALSLATVQHLAGFSMGLDELADAVRRAASADL